MIIRMRELTAFLAELFRHSPRRSIVFLDGDGLSERSFRMSGAVMRTVAGTAGAALVLLTALVITLTPVRNLIPGYDTAEVRQNAILASMRLEALEDSVTTHLQYLTYLKQILTGQIDSSLVRELSPDALPGGSDGIVMGDRKSYPEDWEDHAPAIFIDRLRIRPASSSAHPNQPSPGLLLPAITPIGGYTTQSFNARKGHFGIDIATEEGRIVRSIGEGYVIFADWTHSGGHTIIVQHANGFITVFKHNRRLLKRVAERVQLREGLAVSGNSGQHSTGPHLHFELWNNGLAQDPRPYLLGL